MKERILELIRKGKTEEGLQFGYDFLKQAEKYYLDWISLQSKFNKVKREKTKGIISDADYSLTLNRINSEIIDLLIEVDSNLLETDNTSLSENNLQHRLQNILINEYEILSIESEGTSTVTFKAKELFGDDLVAIKALKTENLAGKSEAFSEVEKLKKIYHRNIISVIGVSKPSSYLKYAILDYIDGTDLNTSIRENGPSALHKTKRVLLQICDALYYLHKRKVFNADLRTSRILIDREGEAIISPFIVFKTHPENNYNQILTNLQHMSYKRLNSPDYKSYDPRSNQFSLGTIAYLLLTGEPLFKEESLIPLMNARIKFEKDEDYRNKKLNKLQDSEELGRIVKRLLSIKRNDRFPNIKKVIDALKQVNVNLDKTYYAVQESYSRARSYNNSILLHLLTELEKKQLKGVEKGINRKEVEKKLHRIISLIIEDRSHQKQLRKALKCKELQPILDTHQLTFREVLFSFLKEADYLWTEELQQAWLTILDDIYEKETIPSQALNGTKP